MTALKTLPGRYWHRGGFNAVRWFSLHIALSAFVVLMPAVGTATAGTPAQDADAALDRALRSLVAMPGGPPGVIAVVQRGGQVRSYTAGYGDVEKKRPPRVTDHMLIASVSKAFSGASALALVQKGLLSLDDTIAQRLPSLPSAWGSVTVRQLLNHTSGVPDYTKKQAFQKDLGSSLTVAPTPEKLLDYIADDPLAFPSGSKYEYSNSDNIIVGLIVQAVTGKPYADALHELVYTPLELTETSLPAGHELPVPFIHGYDRQDMSAPEDISEIYASGWVWASGGNVSTPFDLNRFIRGYVGGKLFGTEVRKQQRAFIPGGSEPPGPGVNAAGLALYRYKTRCGTMYGHSGNTFGFTQYTAASSDGSRSMTISINLQRTDHNEGQAGAVFKAFQKAALLAICAAFAG
jgi:D-alanyl-D-alanine carboxypeptidase